MESPDAKDPVRRDRDRAAAAREGRVANPAHAEGAHPAGRADKAGNLALRVVPAVRIAVDRFVPRAMSVEAGTVKTGTTENARPTTASAPSAMKGASAQAAIILGTTAHPSVRAARIAMIASLAATVTTRLAQSSAARLRAIALPAPS